LLFSDTTKKQYLNEKQRAQNEAHNAKTLQQTYETTNAYGKGSQGRGISRSRPNSKEKL